MAGRIFQFMPNQPTQRETSAVLPLWEEAEWLITFRVSRPAQRETSAVLPLWVGG